MNNQNKEPEPASTMADSSVLANFMDSQTHHTNPIPKLEDFFGDSSSIVHSQTETQDSSLTQIYDHHHNHHHHGGSAMYFNDQQDLKAITGFQAFSTNSGSEVDDSGSMGGGRNHLTGAEFPGHSIESTGTELGFCSGAASTGGLTLGVHNNNNNSLNNNEKSQSCDEQKALVSVDSDSNKKIADTFGQRTSIYRGVTR